MRFNYKIPKLADFKVNMGTPPHLCASKRLHKCFYVITIIVRVWVALTNFKQSIISTESILRAIFGQYNTLGERKIQRFIENFEENLISVRHYSCRQRHLYHTPCPTTRPLNNFNLRSASLCLQDPIDSRIEANISFTASCIQ